jgi:hypothetical protein
MTGVAGAAAERVCRVDPSAEENGLALMLRDMISQNLAARPALWQIFRSLDALIRVAPTDLEDVRVALDFRRGTLVVHDGDGPRRPTLTIRAEAEAVAEMPAVPLVLGLPDLRTADGRRLLESLARGRLRIDGLVRHPDALRKLSLLLAAA